MKTIYRHAAVTVALTCLFVSLANFASAEEEASLPKACIDGTGPGWQQLGGDDFTNVNCAPDTWSWQNGSAHCTGEPVGVIRSKKKYENFELVLEWRHLKPAGNSGVFIWASEEGLQGLEPGQLPKSGTEVQILDNAFATQWEERNNKKADWFTTHGDIFPVGSAKLNPFPPTSPNGSRSFPRKRLSKDAGQWNHYYVRAINGEVRLWVNGEEVSGGSEAQPSSGYLALESEGSPVEFRNILIRELP